MYCWIKVVHRRSGSAYTVEKVWGNRLISARVKPLLYTYIWSSSLLTFLCSAEQCAFCIFLPSDKMSTSMPQPPKTILSQPWPENPSLRDFILRRAFKLGFAIFDFTMIRLAGVVFLLPLYLFVAFLRSFLPFLLKNSKYLLTHSGRKHLRHQGNTARWQRKNQAMLQLDGKYRFHEGLVERTLQIRRVADHIDTIWPARREYFDVCNLRACVVHEIPKQQGEGSRRVVLLHGNPSWSFMYRNVCTTSHTIIQLLTGIGYPATACGRPWSIRFGLDRIRAEWQTFEKGVHLYGVAYENDYMSLWTLRPSGCFHSCPWLGRVSEI